LHKGSNYLSRKSVHPQIFLHFPYQKEVILVS